ncbi:MAG: DUF1839 family protein [Burkholderiales bacterium]|nr:MAG: DUF1839 family protein [Burkholderiales bacterium]
MSMQRYQALPGLQAAGYIRNQLHAEDRVWVEKNCYIDIWIEVLQALRLDPIPMMAFTAAIDFEGDQWTFFKPPHGELYELYGVDVQELNVWRPLVEHAKEHLAGGKFISTEADAFWLPDTAGTDYRSTHTKTTIVLADLDLDAGRLGYFHNAGYFEVDGEDFRQLFRLDAAPDPTFMPLFAETVRFDRLVRRSPQELAELSAGLWRKHLARRPISNPITRFAERFTRELPSLHDKGLAFYHAWAFATIRQLGAAFELGAVNLSWLAEAGGDKQAAALAPAIASFNQISQANKALILKVARAVNTKRTLDAAELFGDMATAWEQGMASLDAAF